VDLAKFLPALLHVTRWEMTATLAPKQTYDGVPKEARYTLSPDSGLVSHYKKGKVYDSILEQALSKRWEATTTEWRLEREVDLVPIPGSVMIPDFRLVHPDGRSYLFEVVGYWRPEYLRRKFMQVAKSGRGDLILAVSERLNLGGAGIDISKTRAKVVWFKGKIEPKDVLAVVEG
jgi:predicted nuclease of restriction endonuclease-like RecB superfamily